MGTENGKASSQKVTGSLEKMTDLERQLIGIWKEALGLDQIGLDDNFFLIGGDSLKAVRIFNRISKETGAEELTVPDIFVNPTVRSLADYIESLGTTGTI